MSLLPATMSDLRTTLNHQRMPLLFVLAFTLLAKGEALMPGYSIDDYQPSVDGPSALLGDVLSKGRAGHWLFLKAAMALGVEPNPARFLIVACSIAAYALFGLAVVRFWGIQGNGWLPLMAACLVANHPYTCEIFTFRIGLPLAALVAVLLSFLLFLACRPRLYLTLGSLLFAFALSLYQIALHFAFMVFLVGVAIVLCRSLRTGPASRFNPRSLFEDRNTRLLLFILSGGVVYVLVGVLFGPWMGVSSQYFGLLPLSRMPDRALQAGTYILTTFAKPNALIAPTIQVTFALIAGCLGISLIWMTFRSPLRISSFWLAIGIAGLLGCAFLWSVGVVLIRQEYWPVPRTMAHVGIFWAGFLVLAALAAPLPWTLRGLKVAAVIILLSFAGASQHVFDDQGHLNVRDRYRAGRIIARLETLAGFRGMRRIAFVGKRAWYPMGPQATQWGDMNISAFAASWSQVSLLEEVSGYDLRPAMASDMAVAKTYCAGAGNWPALDSVAIRGDLGILCLAPSPA